MGRLLNSKTKRLRYTLLFRNHDETLIELGKFATMQEIANRLGCCNQSIWNFIEGKITHGG